MGKSGARLRVTLDTQKMRQLAERQPDKCIEFLDREVEAMINDIKLGFGVSPSAPGQPPGVDTGALRNSLTWERDGDFTRTIHDGVLYGLYLEFGTEKMLPRPFMGPAFERERRDWVAHARAFGLVI